MGWGWARTSQQHCVDDRCQDQDQAPQRQRRVAGDGRRTIGCGTTRRLNDARPWSYPGHTCPHARDPSTEHRARTMRWATCYAHISARMGAPVAPGNGTLRPRWRLRDGSVATARRRARAAAARGAGRTWLSSMPNSISVSSKARTIELDLERAPRPSMARRGRASGHGDPGSRAHDRRPAGSSRLLGRRTAPWAGFRVRGDRASPAPRRGGRRSRYKPVPATAHG